MVPSITKGEGTKTEFGLRLFLFYTCTEWVLPERDQSEPGFKPCLKKPQVFWLINQPQPLGIFAIVVGCFDGFGRHVHMRLGIHAPWKGEPY